MKQTLFIISHMILYKGTQLIRISICFAVKITVFYIIYYAFLSAFFIAMLLIFYQTLNDPTADLGAPRWLAGNGIIGDNPGMYVVVKL